MQIENILLDKYIIFSDCSKLPRADLGTLCPPPLPATISLGERLRSRICQIKGPGPSNV